MLRLDRSTNDTSLTLDLLRAVAAQMVCVGHAISFFVPQLRPTALPLMQNVGVLLFFLISGFLITFTLVEKSKNPAYGFWQFCIDRFSRIYSGLIPALVFIVIIDAIVIHQTNDEVISRYFTLKTMIANLFMLEGYRGIFPNVLQWSAFGSASPLWTLGIEWHIYIFAASLFFMIARPRSFLFLLPVALFYGQTAVHFLFGSFQADGVGRGLFSLWLGGALVYLVARRFTVGFVPATAISLSGILAFVALTPAGAEYDMMHYPLLTLAFFGLVAATQSTHRLASLKLGKPIGFFADYSFSLYLVHHTIMYAMWAMSPARGLTTFAVAVVASNAAGAALAAIGERHHHALAKAIKTRVLVEPKQGLRPLSDDKLFARDIDGRHQ